MSKLNVMMVSGHTSVKKLAGSIAKGLMNGENMKLRAIGASALNQLIKGCIVARGFLVQRGFEISFVPKFVSITVSDEESKDKQKEITSIEFNVEMKEIGEEEE